MGFGLLLCAYFLLTFMSVGVGDYAFLPYLLGAAVAVLAVDKLKAYNPRFKYLYPVAAVYAILAMYGLVTVVANLALWDIPVLEGVVASVASWAQFASEFAFAVLALWASAEVAASVGLAKHRARAWRNVAFTGIWAMLQLLLLAVPTIANAGNQALTKVLFLYQLLVYLLNTYSLYTCFTGICPAGEEFGKPSKPSRFQFMNEINRKLDEKNERARLEYERKLEEQKKKFSAKNNNRHHKKKK